MPIQVGKMVGLTVQEDYNFSVDKLVVLSDHMEQITFVHLNVAIDSIGHQAMACQEHCVVIRCRQVMKEHHLQAVHHSVW